MPQQQKQKGGKGSKGGRSKVKMARRLSNRTTQKNKVVRVLKSCGLKAAEAYGVEHMVLTHLRAYQKRNEK